MLDVETAKVTDYSSSWKIGDDKAQQLKMYAAVAFMLLPALEEVYVETDFIRYDAQRGPDEPFTPDVVQEVKDYIVAAHDEVEKRQKKKDWPATPGSNCAFCYVKDCPAAGNTDTDPVSLGGRIILLKKELKEANEKLQDHVETAGPVEVGDGFFGYNEGVSRSIAVPDWKAAGGSDLALKVGLEEADRLMKKDRDLREAITPHIQKTATVKWGWKKGKKK
jgi:hypothetical protein